MNAWTPTWDRVYCSERGNWQKVYDKVTMVTDSELSPPPFEITYTSFQLWLKLTLLSETRETSSFQGFQAPGVTSAHSNTSIRLHSPKQEGVRFSGLHWSTPTCQTCNSVFSVPAARKLSSGGKQDANQWEEEEEEGQSDEIRAKAAWYNSWNEHEESWFWAFSSLICCLVLWTHTLATCQPVLELWRSLCKLWFCAY